MEDKTAEVGAANLKDEKTGSDRALRPHGLTHLATRIFGCPLLISPDKFNVIMSVLAPRLGLAEPKTEATAAPVAPMDRKPYQVTPDGFAVIPITGTLLSKSYGMDALSGLQSYAEIGMQIEDAATDPAIKGILLDCDSPGGELAGAFDLADMIFQARSAKPIYAVADNNSLSAAYLLASCASKVFATRTSNLGSIGVIMSHVDESAADAQAGLKYTIISAGAKKADLNPHIPLSAEARDTMQSMVDKAYGMLCDAVARNRGMSAGAIQKTEAGIYFGKDAVTAGLADQMGTFADALDALRGAVAAKNAKSPLLVAAAVPPASVMNSVADPPTAEGIKAEAIRIAELCAMADLPGETATLLKSGVNVAQAREHLTKKRAEVAAAAEGISTHIAPKSNRNPNGEAINPQGAELMLAAADRLIEKSRAAAAKGR